MLSLPCLWSLDDSLVNEAWKVFFSEDHKIHLLMEMYNHNRFQVDVNTLTTTTTTTTKSTCFICWYWSCCIRLSFLIRIFFQVWKCSFFFFWLFVYLFQTKNAPEFFLEHFFFLFKFNFFFSNDFPGYLVYLWCYIFLLFLPDCWLLCAFFFQYLLYFLILSREPREQVNPNIKNSIIPTVSQGWPHRILLRTNPQ